MNIMITGSSGFIGSYITRLLATDANNTIYAICHNDHSCKTMNKDITPIISDICNINFLNISNQVDCIIDLAWEGTSGVSRGNLENQIKNIKDRMAVIEWCSKHDCKYIGVGSLMEKESIISTFNDSAKPRSNSFYSHAKYMAHAMTKSYANDLGVEYNWIRITNAYGPYESSPRLINNTIKKIIAGETPSFSSGNQLYDFVHVSDVAQAFMLITKKGKPNKDYLLGSGKPRKLKDYLKSMNKLIAPDMEFIYEDDPDPSKTLSRTEYSIAKLQKDTGFKSKITFEEGIVDTFNSYYQEFYTKKRRAEPDLRNYLSK